MPSIISRLSAKVTLTGVNARVPANSTVFSIVFPLKQVPQVSQLFWLNRSRRTVRPDNGQLKEALLSAFNGAHPDGLASWVLQEAKANPTAGLALLGRLIPVSTEGALDATLTVRHVDETAD